MPLKPRTMKVAWKVDKNPIKTIVVVIFVLWLVAKIF